MERSNKLRYQDELTTYLKKIVEDENKKPVDRIFLLTKAIDNIAKDAYIDPDSRLAVYKVSILFDTLINNFKINTTIFQCALYLSHHSKSDFYKKLIKDIQTYKPDLYSSLTTNDVILLTSDLDYAGNNPKDLIEFEALYKGLIKVYGNTLKIMSYVTDSNSDELIKGEFELLKSFFIKDDNLDKGEKFSEQKILSTLINLEPASITELKRSLIESANSHTSKFMTLEETQMMEPQKKINK